MVVTFRAGLVAIALRRAGPVGRAVDPDDRTLEIHAGDNRQSPDFRERERDRRPVALRRKRSSEPENVLQRLLAAVQHNPSFPSGVGSTDPGDVLPGSLVEYRAEVADGVVRRPPGPRGVGPLGPQDAVGGARQ